MLLVESFVIGEHFSEQGRGVEAVGAVVGAISQAEPALFSKYNL
jgi:hypothetical protein